MPSGPRGDLLELHVPFGAELVHYAVGPASCGVPGLPAGLDLLWREHGRLPWARLCEPALRLARDGVDLPPAHAACLAMLEPVMTMDAGERMYSPGGRLLQAGDRLDQPGLEKALQIVADEGARSVYSGTLAEALLALVEQRGGIVVNMCDDVHQFPGFVPFAGFLDNRDDFPALHRQIAAREIVADASRGDESEGLRKFTGREQDSAVEAGVHDVLRLSDIDSRIAEGCNRLPSGKDRVGHAACLGLHSNLRLTEAKRTGESPNPLFGCGPADDDEPLSAGALKGAQVTGEEVCFTEVEQRLIREGPEAVGGAAER